MTHLYASRAYAEGLAGVSALAVPEWGAHVVRRPIADGLADAAGVYPLAVLARGADLDGGLQRLRAQGLVSVVLVPDPLRHPAGLMARSFEVCRPFKTHLLIDPAVGPFDPSKHHRDRIRRGHRRCRIEPVRLADHLDGWSALYRGLVERRAVSGVAAFGEVYFRMLAARPEVTAFAAFVGETLAGMTLWFAADGVVYNHLTAANALGYANGASFALYDAAIQHFAGAGIVNLGGGAGHADRDDGLSAFKRGFANAETQAHVCGAVLDPARYAALGGPPGDGFFPAYRASASTASATSAMSRAS